MLTILDAIYNDFFRYSLNQTILSLFFPAILGTELISYDLFHHIFMKIYKNISNDKIIEIYEAIYEPINNIVCNVALRDLKLSSNCNDKYYIFSMDNKDYLEEDYSKFIADKDYINELIADYPQVQLLAPLGLVTSGKLIFRACN